MISIKNLSRDWPDFSLRKIDLEVKDEEYFVILGPTGAGKTLLLEIIAGFHTPDEGRIRIGDEDITHKEPEERDLGFVYQDYSLFPHMTIEENVKFGPEVNNFSKQHIAEEVNRVMEFLDIKHLADRYPKTLSGGERQKTALARGLVMDPEILLLDEPISALDMPSQEEMREELKRIHREEEITTIHVTHNREEASWLGDRMGVMNEGKIVQVGTPREIFRSPKSEFVANFVGTDNIFRGKSQVEDGIAKIDIGNGVEIEAISDRKGEVKACIRPEEIIISRNPIESSGRNMMKGKITEITEGESTVKARIDVGREFVVTITKRSRSDLNLEIGKKVYMAFKASSVHVI